MATNKLLKYCTCRFRKREVKFSIYMTIIPLWQEYLRSSLHSDGTLHFSKMSHSADSSWEAGKLALALRPQWSTHAVGVTDWCGHVFTGHTFLHFSKMSHSTDSSWQAGTGIETTVVDPRSGSHWQVRPYLHGARFDAKIFSQITNYLSKWYEIWNLMCIV